jgi:hypothetical protein
VTVFGRLKECEKPFKPFDISPFTNVFNVNRKQAITSKDGMVDPH